MTETADMPECGQCFTTIGPIECVIALTDVKPGEGTDDERLRVCRRCLVQMRVALLNLRKENLDERLAFLDERLRAVQVEG